MNSRTCMDAYKYAHTCIGIQVCIQIHVQLHSYVYERELMCVHVYVCA